MTTYTPAVSNPYVIYLGGYPGKLEYYYIADINCNIEYDPSKKAIVFVYDVAGNPVTRTEIVDTSFYAFSNGRPHSFFNQNNQIPTVNYSTNIRNISQFANVPTTIPIPTQQCMLIALSPPVRTSDAEVSQNGVALTNQGSYGGRNIYIIKDSGPLAFNTTKPITCYYIGAGGQGGQSSDSGNARESGGYITYYNLVGEKYYNIYDARDPVGSFKGDNLYLSAGGAGAAGGGGGGAGAVGKINITSKYLHCNISSTGTEVFTEDKYLGIATAGSNGTDSIKVFEMNANITIDNPPVYVGGSSSIGNGTLPSGTPGQAGAPGTLVNSYTGTVSFTGSTGSVGGLGGRGESQGFLAERLGVLPRLINDKAQDGTQGDSRNALGGSAGKLDAFRVTWDGLYVLRQALSRSGDNTGKPGNAQSRIGFGGGNSGNGGNGGKSTLLRSEYTAAQGGGGGAGGAGGIGFSLDRDIGSPQNTFDIYSSSLGFVIIVV